MDLNLLAESYRLFLLATKDDNTVNSVVFWDDSLTVAINPGGWEWEWDYEVSIPSSPKLESKS